MRFGCDKCAVARDSADAREKYTEQGGKGKGCKPLTKDACCLWEHSLSAAQLVEYAQAEYGSTGVFASKALTPLAKRFMADNMGAAPLGTPHADRTNAKLDHRVSGHSL